jgi:outer membrane receptor protein involved in Fe transport
MKRIIYPKLLAFIVLLAGVSLRAGAQALEPSTGSLGGTILDSVTRQPVPYATVVLLAPSPLNKQLTGAIADEQGRFMLEHLVPGPAQLRVSYVGYSTRTYPVRLTAESINLGSVHLFPEALRLTEALVIGTRPVVEVRPDRLVYNADQDVTNAGGTATDVLRKAPLLTVSGDGKVQLRGSTNFKVLIDNKPSQALVHNLAEALRSIPADQIKSVEVITTPPASYDGEGTAGIINIVLKKKAEEGLNGRAGLSSSNRNTYVSLGLNFQKRKLSVTSSAHTGRWYGPLESSRERTDFSVQQANGLPAQLRQHSVGTLGGGWVFGTLGFDYTPGSYHHLSLTSTVNGFSGDERPLLVNQYAVGDPSLSQVFTRDTRNISAGFTGELTGTYTRTFAQARREWSLLAQAARTDGTFGYELAQYTGLTVKPLEQASYRERSRGQIPGYTFTLQTDFTQPVGTTHTLNLGLKAILRRTSSLASVDTLDPARGIAFTRAPRRTTNFHYSQQVQAAYATYAFGIGKHLKASLGSRLERTALSADFHASTPFTPQNYLSLLPNGTGTYEVSEATSVRFAYSRRITRPFSEYLNPFVDRSNPQNITYGNPNLAPELTDSYELSYATTVARTATLNLSASVRHTNNAIEAVRLATAIPGVTEQTFGNVATNTFYQLNLYGSVKLRPEWEVSGGGDVYYLVRQIPVLHSERHGLVAGLSLNTSYKFPKELTGQAALTATSSAPEIQGRGPANLYYSFGAKKSVLQQKLDITLNITNPFANYWPLYTTTTTALFDEQLKVYSFQRTMRLSISYRFGLQQQNKLRKEIRNDDVKSGGKSHGM